MQDHKPFSSDTEVRNRKVYMYFVRYLFFNKLAVPRFKNLLCKLFIFLTFIYKNCLPLNCGSKVARHASRKNVRKSMKLANFKNVAEGE